MIVLGDSITACFGVDGKDAATCGPKILHSALAAGPAPGITYENLAVSGAITTDVPDKQLATVTTGQAGHALVLIYIGGNDLQTYISSSDSQATAGLMADLPGIRDDWNTVFDFFNNTTNFPDGATILMNNQYNPFDDCTAGQYQFMTPVKNQLLRDYNSELEMLADANVNAYITDQYTPYLGHGHHYNTMSCPHYQPNMTAFMGDLIHPNNDGHAHLAEQWDLMADSMYVNCQ